MITNIIENRYILLIVCLLNLVIYVEGKVKGNLIRNVFNTGS